MITNFTSKHACEGDRNIRLSSKSFKSRRKTASSSKNLSHFSWSVLPVEILSNIFDFTPVRIACKSAAVNKCWNLATKLNGKTTKCLTLTKGDCPFTSHAISMLLTRYSQLDALHFSTEEELPLEAVESISASPYNTRLRSLSGFVVSNCVVGHQPVMSAIAQISSLEELNLDGSLLTGESLRQLAASCTGLPHSFARPKTEPWSFHSAINHTHIRPSCCPASRGFRSRLGHGVHGLP